jgi:hypothetical protein
MNNTNNSFVLCIFLNITYFLNSIDITNLILFRLYWIIQSKTTFFSFRKFNSWHCKSTFFIKMANIVKLSKWLCFYLFIIDPIQHIYFSFCDYHNFIFNFVVKYLIIICTSFAKLVNSCVNIGFDIKSC